MCDRHWWKGVTRDIQTKKIHTNYMCCFSGCSDLQHPWARFFPSIRLLIFFPVQDISHHFSKRSTGDVVLSPKRKTLPLRIAASARPSQDHQWCPTSEQRAGELNRMGVGRDGRSLLCGRMDWSSVHHFMVSHFITSRNFSSSLRLFHASIGICGAYPAFSASPDHQSICMDYRAW